MYVTSCIQLIDATIKDGEEVRVNCGLTKIIIIQGSH